MSNHIFTCALKVDGVQMAIREPVRAALEGMEEGLSQEFREFDLEILAANRLESTRLLKAAKESVLRTAGLHPSRVEIILKARQPQGNKLTSRITQCGCHRDFCMPPAEIPKKGLLGLSSTPL